MVVVRGEATSSALALHELPLRRSLWNVAYILMGTGIDCQFLRIFLVSQSSNS